MGKRGCESGEREDGCERGCESGEREDVREGVRVEREDVRVGCDSGERGVVRVGREGE